MADQNFAPFYAAEADMTTFAPSTASGRSICQFNASPSQRIPMHIRTGKQAFGMPTERKRFKQVEFHGTGTLFVRVYIDGIWICDGNVTLTETPAKDRRLGIPTGTRGYTMDLEFSGDADIRAIESDYSQMSSPS